MAKIQEEMIVIKFSRIIKDSENSNESILAEEIKAALEQVAQELVGEKVIVEVIDNV